MLDALGSAEGSRRGRSHRLAKVERKRDSMSGTASELCAGAAMRRFDAYLDAYMESSADPAAEAPDVNIAQEPLVSPRTRLRFTQSEALDNYLWRKRQIDWLRDVRVQRDHDVHLIRQYLKAQQAPSSD